MLIYHYSENTKEYLNSVEAEKDPEETRVQGQFVPLVPAYATLIEPPEYGENEIPVFENNNWVIKPDYRKNFKKADDNLNITNITAIGEITDGYVVTNDMVELIKENPDKFKVENGEIVQKSDEEYEEEQAQKEAERISMLNLTAADVERAIYKAKGIDFDDVVALASTVDGIDIKALKIELKANNFYRGNPYIDQIGALLGFTGEQLNEFFETCDYTKLGAE